MTLGLAIALSVMGHMECEEMGYIPALDGGKFLMPELTPDSRPEHWPMHSEDYYRARESFVKHMQGYGGILLPLEIQFHSLDLRSKEEWSEFSK